MVVAIPPETSPAGSSSPLLGMTCGVGGPTVNPWGARLGVDPDGSSVFGQLVFQKMKKIPKKSYKGFGNS
jgi:hypothetical protein